MTTKYRQTFSSAGGSVDDLDRPLYYVLGGDALAVSIALGLDQRGHAVRLIDERRDSPDLDVIRGDPTDVRDLETADVAAATTVVVATRRDRQNLLIAQLVRTRFDVEDVVVVVFTPDRCDLVAEAGHRPVCATSVLSETVLETIDSTGLRESA